MEAVRIIWRYGVETIVVILVAVMVATMFLQVFCRFVLGDPLSWSEELARYLFVWVSFLGAAVAYRRGSHIVVETILVLMPRRVQIVLGWVADAFVVVALLALLVHGIDIVEATGNVEATMLQIPMSWVYASVPVSAAVMLGYQAELTKRRIQRLLPPLMLADEAGEKA
jgi:TRAP-type C4-dicarboxylate transport system permease small subunit